MSDRKSIIKNLRDISVANSQSRDGEVENYETDQSELTRFDWASYVINNFIIDTDRPTVNNIKKFVGDQFLLHRLNALSGRTFNPIGIVASVLSDEAEVDSVLNPVVTQTLSALMGGRGAVSTTDGKNFARILDTDSMQRFFELDEFANETSDGGKGFLGSLFGALGNAVTDIVGIRSPDRSILAQVVAYDEESSDLNINGTTDENNEESSESNILTHLKGIGTKAVNYLDNEDLIIRNPRKFLRLRRKIANNELAVNFSIKKQNWAIASEEQNKKRNFFQRIGDNLANVNISNVNQFYNRHDYNGGKMYEPDKDNSDKIRKYNINTNSLGRNEKYQRNENLLIGEKIEQDDSRWYKDFLITNRNLKNHFNLLKNEDTLNTTFLKGVFDLYDEGLIRTSLVNSEGASKKFQTPDNGFKSFSIQKLVNGDRSVYDIPKLIRKKDDDLIKLLDEDRFNDAVLVADIDTHDSIPPDVSGAKSFMYFTDVRTNKKCFLRMTFETISDDSQATFTPINYVGRTEAMHNYESTARSITFPFTVYANTPKELDMMYKKLTFLRSLQYPLAEDGDFTRMKNPMHRLTIKDLFDDVAGHMTSFSYNLNNDANMWNTENGKFVPMIIQCSMSMVVVHDSMPYTTGANNIMSERPFGIEIEIETETESNGTD